jgi:transcriptional regulator with XRE-family HTH domain
MPRRAPGPAHDPPASSAASHGGRRVGAGRPRVKMNLAIAENVAILPGMTAGQLVQLREKLGLSVPEFARLLGVDNTALYRWEAGKSRVRNVALRAQLQDLYDKAFGPPWDRERARLEVAKRLGMDLNRAGQLLAEYGRLDPGEPWRDVAGRVVDGEKHRRLGRVAEA